MEEFVVPSVVIATNETGFSAVVLEEPVFIWSAPIWEYAYFW